jgi:hypothetical protein
MAEQMTGLYEWTVAIREGLFPHEQDRAASLEFVSTIRQLVSLLELIVKTSDLASLSELYVLFFALC